MFIGRWQPWHNGHQWLIDQRLKEGKNVLICIQDVIPDENNPYTSEEVYDNLKDRLSYFIRKGLVKLMIIPPIESVNYGRDVGYEIIEHIPPKDIGKISATNIRKENEN
jgi:cytidyltransferase-like protein